MKTITTTIFVCLTAGTSLCRPAIDGYGFFKTTMVSAGAQQQFFDNLHSVFADVNVLEGLGWNTPRFAVNMAILSIVGGVIVLSVILALRRSIRNKFESVRSMSKLFSENCIRCDLTEQETALLQAMVRRQDLPRPPDIFQSVKLFEQCVDEEVRYLVGKGQVSDEKTIQELFSELRMKMGFTHLPPEHPLASSRNISIGQTGSLFTEHNNHPLYRKISVMNNTAFFLTLKFNVEKEEPHHELEGQPVRFVFARRNDGLYEVPSVVVKTDDAGVVELRHTIDLKRNQLRKHVRIETNLPLRFKLLKTSDAEKSEVKAGEFAEASFSDISGGGLSFIYEHSLRLGDIISLEFDLPGVQCRGITGKIVHMTLRETKESVRFKNHVQFVNIEQHKREKIISYIFEKERLACQWR
jgi:c-di-GMP-binding flagellar brake protein YcgR